MGMTANFKVLNHKEYSDLLSNSLSVEELLFPEGVDDPFEGQTDLDKNWHTIHYLLTGAQEPDNSALGSAILGGEEFGEDLGYGPARLIPPAKVAEISSALVGVNLSEKYDQINKDDPVLAQLYRSFEFIDGEKEHLDSFFSELIKMYAEAANNKNAVVAYLA